jgi:hypothetical protein
VASISTSRKIGIAARVAARQAGRSRRLGAVLRGARVTFSSIRRVFHLLWLEVTGFFFLALAAIGCAALVHEYSKHVAGRAGAAKLALAGCFMAMFAYFGVTSFWRARKKR